MKFEDFTVADLKKHAKGAVKGYSTMGKPELIKHLKKNFKVKGGSLERREAKEPIGRTAAGGALGSNPATWTPEAIGAGLQASRQKLRQAIDDHKRLVGALRSVHQQNSQGGQLPCRVTEKMKDLKMEKDNEVVGSGVIDWEDIKWGSFKAQFDQYNSTHKKKFKDLDSFANHILEASKGTFKPTTLKRARFYKNVLSRKKS